MVFVLKFDTFDALQKNHEIKWKNSNLNLFQHQKEVDVVAQERRIEDDFPQFLKIILGANNKSIAEWGLKYRPDIQISSSGGATVERKLHGSYR